MFWQAELRDCQTVGVSNKSLNGMLNISLATALGLHLGQTRESKHACLSCRHAKSMLTDFSLVVGRPLDGKYGQDEQAETNNGGGNGNCHN